MDAEGKYISARIRGNGTRPFNKTARTNFTDEFAWNKRINPGPGNYDKPS